MFAKWLDLVLVWKISCYNFHLLMSETFADIIRDFVSL